MAGVIRASNGQAERSCYGAGSSGLRLEEHPPPDGPGVGPEDDVPALPRLELQAFCDGRAPVVAPAVHQHRAAVGRRDEDRLSDPHVERLHLEMGLNRRWRDTLGVISRRTQVAPRRMRSSSRDLPEEPE